MIKKFLAGAALFVAASSQAQYALPPFRPVNTTNLAITGTAQNLTLPTDLAGSDITQYVLSNVGTQTVFCRSDGTTATVNNGMPILSGSQILITLKADVRALSCIAASTGSTLYSTAGVGQ